MELSNFPLKHEYHWLTVEFFSFNKMVTCVETLLCIFTCSHELHGQDTVRAGTSACASAVLSGHLRITLARSVQVY